MNVLPVFIHTGSQLYIRNRFGYLFLMNHLQKFAFKNQIEIDEVLKKRIWFYTMQSALTNLWFCSLRGKPLRKNEIKAGLYLGAYTPLYDDLMDEKLLTHAELVNRIGNEGLTDPQLLLLSWLQKHILKNLLNENQYAGYFKQLGVAQNNSIRQQTQDPLSLIEIEEITLDKGGFATLLYRSILHHRLIPNEEKAIYKLGGALQLVNDVFDIYKDHKKGIQTLLTTTNNINAIATLFDEMVKDIFRMFLLLDYHPKNISKMLLQVSTILSRGKVCFEQLQALTSNNKSFAVNDYSRHQLICDMQKLKNIKRSMVICKSWRKEISF